MLLYLALLPDCHLRRILLDELVSYLWLFEPEAEA